MSFALATAELSLPSTKLPSHDGSPQSTIFSERASRAHTSAPPAPPLIRLPSRCGRVSVAIAFRGVLRRPVPMECSACLCAASCTPLVSQSGHPKLLPPRACDAVRRCRAPIASSHDVSVLRPCVSSASAHISSAWQALCSDAMLSAVCSACSCRGVCRPNASVTGGARSRRHNVPVAQACRRLLHVFFVLQPDVCFLCARLRLDGARAP